MKLTVHLIKDYDEHNCSTVCGIIDHDLMYCLHTKEWYSLYEDETHCPECDKFYPLLKLKEI